MSLTVGDHLVIKRGGILVDPESEAYHEFEVMGTDKEKKVLPFVASESDLASPYQYKAAYRAIRLRVVK